MKKVADNLWRQTTVRQTKSGPKTYIYYYTKGTTGKRKFERMPVTAARQRIPLSASEIEELVNEVDDFVTHKALQNQIRYRQARQLPVTAAWIEDVLEEERLSRQEQFIKNLGYSEEEFEEEFGLAADDLAHGTFERQGNLVTFIAEDGEILYFIWDYERALVQEE